MQRLSSLYTARVAQYLPKTGRSLRVGLSSLVLASLLGTPSGLAATQTPEPAAAGHSETTTISLFGLGEAIRTITETVEEVQDLVDTVQRPFAERARQQQEEEERQLRALEAQQRQEEREAAARAAAEQRRQYFESLTPEQQQAYVAEQERRQQEQMDMISQFFLGALISSFGSDSGSSEEQCVIIGPDGHRQVVPKDTNNFTCAYDL